MESGGLLLLPGPLVDSLACSYIKQSLTLAALDLELPARDLTVNGTRWNVKASHYRTGGRDQGKTVKGKKEVEQGCSQSFPRVPGIRARLGQ